MRNETIDDERKEGNKTTVAECSVTEHTRSRVPSRVPTLSCLLLEVQKLPWKVTETVGKEN